MKPCTLFMIVAASGLLITTSCKKKNNNDQVRNNLIGKWAPANEAKDLNGNKLLDADELTGPILYTTHTLVYDADGTVKIMTQNNKLGGEFNWSLEYNNTYLKTTDIGTGGLRTYQHIDKINSSELVLRDTTGAMIQWYLFARQ